MDTQNIQTKGRLLAYGAEGNTPKEAGCEPSKGSDVADQPWALPAGWLAMQLPRFEQPMVFSPQGLVSKKGVQWCSPTYNTDSTEGPEVNLRVRVKNLIAMNSTATSTNLWLHLRQQPKFTGLEFKIYLGFHSFIVHLFYFIYFILCLLCLLCISLRLITLVAS